MELSPVKAGQWVVGYRDETEAFRYVAAVDATEENAHRVYDIDVIQSGTSGVAELQEARYSTANDALDAVAQWYSQTHEE